MPREPLDPAGPRQPVTIALGPTTLAALDALRGEASRSAYLAGLIDREAEAKEGNVHSVGTIEVPSPHAPETSPGEIIRNDRPLKAVPDPQAEVVPDQDVPCPHPRHAVHTIAVNPVRRVQCRACGEIGTPVQLGLS